MRRSVRCGLVAGVVLGAGLTAVPSASAVVAKGDPGACDRTYAARLAEGSDRKAEPTAMSAREQRSYERTLTRRLHKMGYDSRAAAARGGGRNHIVIDTFVHVLRKNNGEGNVSNRQINRQIKVMNNGFAGRTDEDAASTRFRFRVKDIDRTKKTDWYDWGFRDDDKVAKKALHRGTFQDLNIYIANLSGGLLGYAFFPGLPKKRMFRDGLVILNESMPGGSAAPYNKGDTATHELGHWLGLYHTFQNGCSNLSDRVEDTPRQEAGDNIFECDETLNTCAPPVPPPNPKNDPVHNFMNYTDDPCINQFTRGQGDRMKLSWLAYRKGR